MIARGLVLATADGRLEESTTCNWMLDQLKARQSKVEDLQSAQIVCELMDLGLHRNASIDAEVRAAFERGQIDHTYVGLDCWESAGDVNPTLDLDKWSDPTEQLEQWCYYFVTDDASPIGATYAPNPKSSGARLWNEERQLKSAFKQIRNSTDDRFPLDAFRVAQTSFAGFYEPAIELIRSGMTEYARNAAGQRLNGAYVGLAWIVSNKLPLPIDLLQSILNLPEEERESIFGDQFNLVVHAAALTPAAEYEWVEQWIWDTSRSSADRLSMVEFYLHACVYTMLSRDDAVNYLVAGLKRAFEEDPLLIGPYAEALAYFGPGDYQELLQTAFEQPDVAWFHPIETLDRMLSDAEFGKSEYEQHHKRELKLENIISSGVVFDDPFKPAQPQSSPPLRSSQSYEPLEEPAVSTTTIRNDVRVSRNAPCPCGSGKKFKKCCLRK